jgi:hypothetical protein
MKLAQEMERISLSGSFARETLGGGELLSQGTPKDMLSKALEIGVCFHMGPAFGERGGKLLSYGL